MKRVVNVTLAFALIGFCLIGHLSEAAPGSKDKDKVKPKKPGKVDDKLGNKSVKARNQERKAQRFAGIICKNGTFAIADPQGAFIESCKTSGEYGDYDKKHPNCIFWCMNRKDGFNLLESNGLPSKEIYEQWVDEKFPEPVKDAAKAHFGECYAKYGTKIEPNDPRCEMAAAYNKCNWELTEGFECK